MLHLDDLAQIAEDLRKIGVDASHEFLYGPHACHEGLNVADDFFPLWELSLLENQDAFERYDFAAIKSRRGPDWSIEPHGNGREATS
jgi:hypothetical protein